MFSQKSQWGRVSRIRRLPIFFIGIGFYALIGEILRHLLILEAIIITYITVEIVVGIIGIVIYSPLVSVLRREFGMIEASSISRNSSEKLPVTNRTRLMNARLQILG